MSKIEWTEKTWNPLTGCSRKSDGCKNCYAEKMTERLAKMGQEKYQGLLKDFTDSNGKTVSRFNGVIKFHDDALMIPLRTRKPTTWFVNSMSDLFHENVKDEWIDKIFAVIALRPQHTFQILTKRPERMAAYFSEKWQPAPAQNIGRFHIPAESVGEDRRCQISRAVDDLVTDHKLVDLEDDNSWTSEGGLKVLRFPWPLPNVWLGTSIENQKTADERIPHLLQTPAAVRFLSVEPLLEAVDLEIFPTHKCNGVDGGERHGNANKCNICGRFSTAKREGIDWVIVGGESGPGARPMHPDWARSIRDQCIAAGVKFFFKQWGAWTPERPEHYHRVSGKRYSSESFCWGKNMKPYRSDEPDNWIGSATVYKVGKKQAGRLLDGREWSEMPGDK